MTEIPVLLLAAGSSARMGQPKQLLPWGDTTLIEHQVKTLMKTGNPVNLILGFDSDLIIPIIENYMVSYFVNADWESGMGSSVSFGISQIIRQYPKADGALICLLDQPLITSEYLVKMIGDFPPGRRKILASHSSSGWTGVPVIFDKYYFKELAELKNDEGAKKIIQQQEKNLITEECDDITDDMDTPESYQKLWNKYADRAGI